MDQMIGQTISHYKILEKLGEGGMGVVYKAHDTQLDRDVALKFLPPELTRDTESKERFVHEAKAASALEHSNICNIHEIGETDDGRSFIVMACYSGETVKDKIKRSPLSVDEAVDIATQIAQGLAKAHEKGIVHRDIKPANIMVTEDAVAKILDFGLAKLSGLSHLTRTGTTVGTAAYMSPEQTRGEAIDKRSDIWSVGVVLYEMLAGRLPFRGEHETAMMYSVLNEDPEPIQNYRPEVPENLKSIINHCLEKESANRYQSSNEMLDDLIKQGGKSVTFHPNNDPDQIFSVLLPLFSRKKILHWSAAGGILALLAVLFILSKGKNQDSATTVTDRSVAILPFENIGDSAASYLSTALALDMGDDLKQYQDVTVVEVGNVNFYGGPSVADSSIVSDIGVRFVLRGEFQATISQVRLRTSLYDRQIGSICWRETIELPRSDCFSLKERVLSAITPFFNVDTSSRHRGVSRPSFEVYDAYLHGVYYRTKQTKDDTKMAQEYFSLALSRDTSYRPAMIAYANALVENRDSLALAERYCRKILNMDSTNAAAWGILGNLADEKGERDKAVTLLLKSLSFDDNNIYALTLLGFMYMMELNQPRKALIYLKKVQELHPTNWLMALNLGVGYGQMKQYKDAKEMFRRAMRLNPNHSFPPYSMGYTCERLGEIDSAINYYFTALLKNERDPLTYDGLASILLVSNQSSRAESVLIVGVSKLPDDYQLLYALGIVFRLEGKSHEADSLFQYGLTFARRHFQKDQDSSKYYIYSALFHARLGNVKDALRFVAFAIESRSGENNPLEVARIYSVLRMKDQLLLWYERAKAMNPEYDVPFLKSAWDFESYRTDPDLLTIARRE